LGQEAKIINEMFEEIIGIKGLRDLGCCGQKREIWGINGVCKNL